MITEFTKYLNFKNSLTKTALFIFLLAIVSTFDLLALSTSEGALSQQLFTFGFVIMLALAAFYITKFKLLFQQVNPLNFLITSLIVYMLIHPGIGFGWYLFYVSLAIIFAWVGKFFLKYKNMPIFNPAAFGISTAYALIVGLGMIGIIKISGENLFIVSWWGADLQQLFMQNFMYISVIFSTLLLAILIYLAHSFRKTTHVASIFMTYAIGRFLYDSYLINASASFTNTIDFLSSGIFTSFAFLLLIMFPEPKTSPTFPKQQVVVGIIAGLLLLFVNDVLPNTFGIGFELGMLLAILGANLVTLMFKSRNLLMR